MRLPENVTELRCPDFANLHRAAPALRSLRCMTRQLASRRRCQQSQGLSFQFHASSKLQNSSESTQVNTWVEQVLNRVRKSHSVTTCIHSPMSQFALAIRCCVSEQHSQNKSQIRFSSSFQCKTDLKLKSCLTNDEGAKLLLQRTRLCGLVTRDEV